MKESAANSIYIKFSHRDYSVPYIAEAIFDSQILPHLNKDKINTIFIPDGIYILPLSWIFSFLKNAKNMGFPIAKIQFHHPREEIVKILNRMYLHI